MNLLLKLKNKLAGKQEKSVEDSYVKAMYIVMRKMHLSYEELKKLPLPTFIELLKEISEEAKEGKKPPKKSGMQKGKK
jgi:hypothetical protein